MISMHALESILYMSCRCAHRKNCRCWGCTGCGVNLSGGSSGGSGSSGGGGAAGAVGIMYVFVQYSRLWILLSNGCAQ